MPWCHGAGIAIPQKGRIIGELTNNLENFLVVCQPMLTRAEIRAVLDRPAWDEKVGLLRGMPSCPARPRQRSSVLPEGRWTRRARKSTWPRKTGKSSQEIAECIGENYEAVGAWLADIHKGASPPSPGGRARARPEKCRSGRVRRSWWRCTRGRRRSATGPTTGCSSRCTGTLRKSWTSTSPTREP